MPVLLIVGYGLVRLVASAFNELRDAVFAPVRYRVARDAALRSFMHMHDLSLRFHLDRRTGASPAPSNAARKAWKPCCGWGW